MAYEQTLIIQRTFGASAVAQLTVPIYQGGAEYSLIRQSKETLAQQRLDLDTARDQARAARCSLGPAEAAKAQSRRRRLRCTAAEIALNGVREEARVGQRTTLDVLNAQQALVNARVALVTAQHDRVVASYTVLSRSAGCRRRCWAFDHRPTTRACITIRSATAGPACARPTDADRS